MLEGSYILLFELGTSYSVFSKRLGEVRLELYFRFADSCVKSDSSGSRFLSTVYRTFYIYVLVTLALGSIESRASNRLLAYVRERPSVSLLPSHISSIKPSSVLVRLTA